MKKVEAFYDCKIAFNITETVLRHTQNQDDFDFIPDEIVTPLGVWEMCEIDGGGCVYVAVYRPPYLPTENDCKVVRDFLNNIGK